MIDIIDVIEYLRSKLAINVDGAAEYEAAEDKSRLPVPAIYVALGGVSLSPPKVPDTKETMEQYYDQRILIQANISNIDDRTGKYAQAYVYVLRNMLLRYLYGHMFLPDDEAYPLQYVGDRMITMHPAHYWHQFEFKQVGVISPEDYLDPLVLDNFQRFYADWNLTESPVGDHPDAQDHLEKLYDGVTDD